MKQMSLIFIVIFLFSSCATDGSSTLDSTIGTSSSIVISISSSDTEMSAMVSSSTPYSQEFSSSVPSSSLSSSSETIVFDTIADRRYNGSRIDSTKYPLVKIGNQVWLASNMSFYVNDRDQYRFADDFKGYYSWTLADTICPEGMHLPSRMEWESLIQFAGGDTVALRKLKHSKWYWMDKDFAYYLGTDDFGFGAAGAGNQTVGNNLTVVRGDAYFWTSTNEGDSAYTVHFHKNDLLEIFKVHKTNFRQSVRCLKD